jgi:hypothetical protein
MHHYWYWSSTEVNGISLWRQTSPPSCYLGRSNQFRCSVFYFKSDRDADGPRAQHGCKAWAKESKPLISLSPEGWLGLYTQDSNAWIKLTGWVAKNREGGPETIQTSITLNSTPWHPERRCVRIQAQRAEKIVNNILYIHIIRIPHRMIKQWSLFLARGAMLEPATGKWPNTYYRINAN